MLEYIWAPQTFLEISNVYIFSVSQIHFQGLKCETQNVFVLVKVFYWPRHNITFYGEIPSYATCISWQPQHGLIFVCNIWYLKVQKQDMYYRCPYMNYNEQWNASNIEHKRWINITNIITGFWTQRSDSLNSVQNQYLVVLINSFGSMHLLYYVCPEGSTTKPWET